MEKLTKKYNKRIALFISMILFVVASGYTCFFALSKTITVEINERRTSNSIAKVNVITNANTNKTIREILSDNDFPIDDNYVYDIDLDTKVREIDTITIDKKVNGTIQVDDQFINYSSGAQTIGDVIAENAIVLSTIDTVEPDILTPLNSENSEIVIHRQNQEREKREDSIAYQTIEKVDSTLNPGAMIIEIPGIEGKKIVTEDVKYQDGVAVSRTLISEDVLLEPINQVVRVGTGSANSTSTSNAIANLGYNGTTLNASDFDLVCAVVEHEGGSDYESALAVMSCVMNRVDSRSYPNDPVSVLTAPGQFESYFAGYYKQFLGNSSTSVRQAVTDCLNGKRNHNYLSFRGYKTTNSVKIGGNWYFNE